MAKEQEPLFVYGNKMNKAVKGFIFTIVGGLFGLYIVSFIVIFLGMALLGLGAIFSWIVYVIAFLVYILAVVQSVKGLNSAKRDKSYEYQFVVDKNGINVMGQFVPWANLSRIIVQVGRTANRVVYSREYHHVVVLDRKNGEPIKMVVEKEILGGFDYRTFVKALVKLGKEKLLRGIGEEDHKLLEEMIRAVKNEK